MSRELLQQSLEALSADHHFGDYDALCAALRSALEAPEPEPVAWMYTIKLAGNQRYITRHQIDLSTYKADKVWPLYAAPPTDEWKSAMLDRLAVLCMDAPVDEPPASILRRIIDAEVAIPLDPSVSDVAPPAPARVPLTDEGAAELLGFVRGVHFDAPGLDLSGFSAYNKERIRLVQIGWNAAHGIGGSNG